MYSFIFLLLILAGSLSAAAIARFKIISGSGFERILRNEDALSYDCSVNTMILDAPEDWDTMLFNTEIVIAGCEKNRANYYWRVATRKQPNQSLEFIKVLKFNPHVIILVQDSSSLCWASTEDYGENRVYFRDLEGNTYPSENLLSSSEYLSVPEGTYFTGYYGNIHMRAPKSPFNSNTGAMPVSTMYIEQIYELCELINLGQIALSKTSHNAVINFSNKTAQIVGILKALRFNEENARISKSLYELTGKFPEECNSSSHVIMLTDGMANDDGDIPEWLKDYDRDSNPNDTHITGYGSHCLDDVSSYAASKKIAVHVVGPKTEFLDSVLSKGTGKYLPGVSDIYDEAAFVSTPMVISNNKMHFFTNRYGRFAPEWLNKDQTKYYKISNSGIVSCPPYISPGPAVSLGGKDDYVYISSVGDVLNQIHMISDRLLWSVKGIGGRVECAGGYTVAGPSAEGKVFCINDNPDIVWSSDADFFNLSNKTAFIVKANTIRAYEISSGKETASCHLNSEVSSLSIDPTSGLIYAGTSDGKIVAISQELEIVTVISTPADGAILDIHTFKHRKNIYLTAYTEKRVFCTDMSKVLWSRDIDNGKPVQMLIMDARLYIVSWDESQICGGIDNGNSYLIVFDSLNGDIISSERFSEGYLFGPFVDIKNSRIVFSNYDMKTFELDITLLKGIKPVFAGTSMGQG